MQMRIPMVILVFPLFACMACSAQAQGPSEVPKDSVPLPMEQVFTAQYTGIDQPRRLVIRTPLEWQAIWSELRREQYPITAPAAVDFSRSMVILAAMGMRSTGGHAICIDRSVQQWGASVRSCTADFSAVRGPDGTSAHLPGGHCASATE